MAKIEGKYSVKWRVTGILFVGLVTFFAMDTDVYPDSDILVWIFDFSCIFLNLIWNYTLRGYVLRRCGCLIFCFV